MNKIEELSINAIRILSADAIQKANSGHPGLPLGCASIAYELWGYHMKHNPRNPKWINRDRFILSGGHGSMLLYSLLHLWGYGDLSIDDIKSFRQLDSITPGHPEYGHTVGVEATTGPLGAGMAMGVGMAIAEKYLSGIFNKEQYPVINHYTFVLGGDGCLMEGISSEAFSLAGTLGLGKLIILYDSNNITIEGDTNIAFTEDVLKRCESYGFQTLSVDDGNDVKAIKEAIEIAKSDINRPSIIKINTKIGFGCPKKEGKPSAHGEPLGADNVKELRKNLKWPFETPFYIPPEVYSNYKKLSIRGQIQESNWNELLKEYFNKYPDMQRLWKEIFETNDYDINQILTTDFFEHYIRDSVSTRELSGYILNSICGSIPKLIGGSADLAPSVKTYMENKGDFSKINSKGRNIHFGIRELAMAGISNGILLHSGLRTYVSTFLVFSDYMKPMIRLSSLMSIPAIYIFTHDSIAVGEDGPTHEPIEQLAMLRSIPNLTVFRPADIKETAVAWSIALNSQNTPTAIILSRQALPSLINTSEQAKYGAYIVYENYEKELDGVLIATGSELNLAIEAAKKLDEMGHNVRVVSMPSCEIFDEQTIEYKEKILPKEIRRRVSIEASSGFGWDKYIGLDGIKISIESFGASGKSEDVLSRYGFTVDNIVKAFLKL